MTVTTPNLVHIDSPAPDAILTGLVTVSASVADGEPAEKVEFWIDEALVAADTSAPYEFAWDTSSYTTGTHVITARAYLTETAAARSVQVYTSTSNYGTAEIDAKAQEQFQALDEDAKNALRSYLANEYNRGQTQLASYHARLTGETWVAGGGNAASVTTNSTAALDVLGTQLKALDLPWALRYALMADGAAIAAAIVEGPLPVGDIFAIISGVASVAIIAYYWDDFSAKWPGIKAAFSEAFSTAATEVGLALEELLVKVLQRLLPLAWGATILDSAIKHVDNACLEQIRRTSPVEAYFSSVDLVLLGVYRVTSGIQCSVWNDLQRKEGTWASFAINGAYLYLLVDVRKFAIRHSHFRSFAKVGATMDVEWMRYRNHLNWRILPTPLTEDRKYLKLMPESLQRAFFDEKYQL